MQSWIGETDLLSLVALRLIWFQNLQFMDMVKVV